MYIKILLVIMTILSLFIISWSSYKNEILWFIMILIHHTITTYKLVRNINTNWFLKFKNFEYLSIMIIFTALLKMSFWYTNWAYIINNIIWIEMNPILARILVLLIVIVLIVMPIYFYDKKKKK